MAGGWDRVLWALEELSGAELRRVKAALNRPPPGGAGGGPGPIPRGRMEGADALDLAHLIVGHYGEGFGLRVTAQALRRSQRRDLAEALVGEEAPRPSPPADPPRDVTAPPPPPAELFVRRHRLLLTQRVTGVGALLDHLEAAEVLTTEGVAEVAAASTPQERMRRLLATAPSWGRRGHEEFLKALRLLHPLLMEELEGGEDLQWSSPNP